MEASLVQRATNVVELEDTHMQLASRITELESDNISLRTEVASLQESSGRDVASVTMQFQAFSSTSDAKLEQAQVEIGALKSELDRSKSGIGVVVGDLGFANALENFYVCMGIIVKLELRKQENKIARQEMGAIHATIMKEMGRVRPDFDIKSFVLSENMSVFVDDDAQTQVELLKVEARIKCLDTESQTIDNEIWDEMWNRYKVQAFKEVKPIEEMIGVFDFELNGKPDFLKIQEIKMSINTMLNTHMKSTYCVIPVLKLLQITNGVIKLPYVDEVGLMDVPISISKIPKPVAFDAHSLKIFSLVERMQLVAMRLCTPRRLDTPRKSKSRPLWNRGVALG